MPRRPHLVWMEPLIVNLLNFYLHWLVEHNRMQHSSCVSNFSIPFSDTFRFWRQRNLEMFLVAWTRCSALHWQGVRSEVVQHQMLLQWDWMRPPKRNTLTFTVALRSIPKCMGSMKIVISKQNRSDQLFEVGRVFFNLTFGSTPWFDSTLRN